jgi:hypothetical protein
MTVESETTNLDFQILDLNNKILVDANDDKLNLDKKRYGFFSSPYPIKNNKDNEKFNTKEIEIPYTHPEFGSELDPPIQHLKLRIFKKWTGHTKDTIEFPLDIYRNIPKPTISPSSAMDCPGQLITLISSDANQYLWSNGDRTKSTVISASGKYSLTVLDSKGCLAKSDPIDIKIEDKEAPKFTCPKNLTVNAKTLQCYATIPIQNLGYPSNLTDNCPLATYTSKSNAGKLTFSVTNNAPGTYPVGNTNVVWTVTDSSGNKGTCTQQITVIPFVCGTPYLPTVVSVTSNSAKVNWKSGFCATEYNVRYRTELSKGLYSPWTDWVVTSGPSLTHLFSGLKKSQKHVFQLRTKCGTTYSGIAMDSFTTKSNFRDDNIGNRSIDTSQIENLNLAIITLIPNPASNHTTLLLEEFSDLRKEVIFYDLFGKKIFNVFIDASINQIDLDFEQYHIKPGFYYISVSDSKIKKSVALVVIN